MTTDQLTLLLQPDESPVEPGGGAPLLGAGPHHPPPGAAHLKQILELRHQNFFPQVTRRSIEKH